VLFGSPLRPSEFKDASKGKSRGGKETRGSLRNNLPAVAPHRESISEKSEPTREKARTAALARPRKRLEVRGQEGVRKRRARRCINDKEETRGFSAQKRALREEALKSQTDSARKREENNQENPICKLEQKEERPGETGSSGRFAFCAINDYPIQPAHWEQKRWKDAGRRFYSAAEKIKEPSEYEQVDTVIGKEHDGIFEHMSRKPAEQKGRS